MWDRLVSLASRLHDMVVRRRVDDEARREFDTHLDLLTERYVRLGMPHDEARRAAHRQFGNALLVREEIYESRRLRWVDDLRHDVRYTLRMLHRSRSFAAISILSLRLDVDDARAGADQCGVAHRVGVWNAAGRCRPRGAAEA